MGLLSSKQKNHDALVKSQGLPQDESNMNNHCGQNGGNWKTKTKHYDPDLDVGNMLQRLANYNYYYGNGGQQSNYSFSGGAYTDYSPNDLDDMDMNPDTVEEYRPSKQRHLKYEKDILALLNGGNVPDTDVEMNLDMDLDQVNKEVNKEFNYDEGCGCSSDRIIYGGNQLQSGSAWSSHKEKKHWSIDDEDDEDKAFDLLAKMIQKGGKKKDKKSIILSSTALSSSPSPVNISSSSSVGYKTSNNELNIMPFYSTPDSTTSSIGGKRSKGTYNEGSASKSTFSATSTLHSSTSTISSSLKQYNISTTSDNYLSRPVSKKRY